LTVAGIPVIILGENNPKNPIKTVPVSQLISIITRVIGIIGQH
jgi:hypothetical protein